MSNPLGSLSDNEVKQIVSLMEKLEQTSFDYLRLEMGEMKITLGKGHAQGEVPAAAPAVAPVAASPVAQSVKVATPAAAAAAAVAPAPAAAAPAPAAAAPVRAAVQTEDGTVAITAPIVGRFYAQPEPGAPPFVTVGSEVAKETTVGLLEVMKVFSAIRAGVSGVVTEICVQDAQFVEFGQVLFRVRPTGAKG